jgi:hypothetical protein
MAGRFFWRREAFNPCAEVFLLSPKRLPAPVADSSLPTLVEALAWVQHVRACRTSRGIRDFRL